MKNWFLRVIDPLGDMTWTRAISLIGNLTLLSLLIAAYTGRLG